MRRRSHRTRPQGRLRLALALLPLLLAPLAAQAPAERYRPSIEIERARMQRFSRKAGLDEPCEQVVLFFADSTPAQLEAAIPFGAGTVPDGLKDRVRAAISYLRDDDEQSLDVDVLRPLLNGERSGMFYAPIAGSGDPWMFRYDPAALESVQLLTRARGMLRMARFTESVAQHRPLPDTTAVGTSRERAPDACVRRYTMQLRLARTGIADLSFHADAELELTTDTAAGPWLAFSLYPKRQVHSARWTDRGRAEVFEGKESGILWVRLPERLEPGQTRRLRLSYHGDLVDRLRDWFVVKSLIAWYPLAQDNRRLARFDLDFTTPEDLLLASVGARVDSVAAGNHTVRTRWTTARPIRNASFNLGIFEAYRLAQLDVPPVTVLWSERMHSAVSANAGRIGGLPGKHMDREVAADVAGALQFFQRGYGPVPVEQFYATEIPALHGEALPDLINMSSVTFLKTDDQGRDEQFRAHEVAHQWWGISVDYATYRDRWLSEGFADFSGLWYMQTRRRSNDRYFDMLDRWKGNILERRDDPAPIWLGHRVGTATTGDDYSAIVYRKGAGVLHMLRTMLLDLKSMNEERVPPTFLAYVPVAVELGDNRVARFRVRVTGAHSELALPPVPARPKKVTINDLHGVLAEVKTASW